MTGAEAMAIIATAKLQGERANLSGADLSGASLFGADLSRASLYGANLSRASLSLANLSSASLSRANLYGANLYGANLSFADLCGASLSSANLSGANLSRASLSGADLSRADLSYASLPGADLYGANLSRADLHGADLSRANLSRANLYSASLSGAKVVEKKGDPTPAWIIKGQIVPQVGSFTAFKHVSNRAIAVLLIPATAQRVGGLLGRKCRASSAKVVDILTTDGAKSAATKCNSLYDSAFIYRRGRIVTPSKDFDPDPLQECASGIHCYLTFEEARDHT